MGVELGLLGDVEVRVGGRPVEVGHARQRCVLAVLLVEANRVVSVDHLVARVWGDRTPRRARETLYNYLSRLRHALGPVTGVDLARRSGGYVLSVDAVAVDVHRFHHLVALARATGEEDRALGLFEQALGLWRGQPFGGLDTPWLNGLRQRWERDRLAAELDCTDLRLRHGQHGRLLGELFTRAGTHPLDERVAGQLMLALYQDGRQAEALECFQQLRVRLAEKLGIDPGPGLHRLYEQILTTDPALAAPTMSESVPVPAPPVPRQLPAYTPHFVGRAAELHRLSTLLDAAGKTEAGGGAVVITAIGGTAGIGKTALALHWAHQVAARFPDGQLYVNLRGFDPTNTPLHPADALRGFLDALAVAPQRIPATVEAQAGLYRSLLAERRMLMVLDNARDAEQVRPLLPASAGCLAVITSRNQLPGLTAQHGAHPLTLDLLSLAEARTLLTRQLGPDRINAEPHAVTDLIDYCARLPLALTIVAARAATHPGFALHVLAKELAEEHTRLDALDTGDPTTNVRAVFSWSYQHLSHPAARTFRLLGLHPGPDLPLPAATQLADLTPHQTRQALDELTRANLLTQHAPGRYTFHDLLRAYAAEQAASDPEDDRREALTRLFDHYLHGAAAAMDTVHAPDHQHRPDNLLPATPPPPVADPATARAWLDTERANLTAIMAYTAAHGWHTHTTELANTVLLRHLELSVPYRDALAVYTHVRDAARRTSDRVTEALALTRLGFVHWLRGHYPQAAEHHQHALTLCREIDFPYGRAMTLTHLGLVYWNQGRYQQAAEHHQHALALSREIGNRVGGAFALTNLGLVHWRQGRYQQAAEHHQHALALSREIGNRVGGAFALTNLGLVHWRQGRYQQAAEHHQHALTICRETGDRFIEALALGNIGLVHCQRGRYQEAAEHYQHALAVCREIGFRAGEAFALTNLGLVHYRQGRYQQAAGHHQHALTICREIGDRAIEAEILNSLGKTHHATGQHKPAHTHHTAALTLATELDDRYEQARAHHGLAHTHHTTGNPDQARHHRQQALTLFTDLNVPDTDDVRAHLNALD